MLASGKSANPQMFNRYSYVMNNPLAYTDPNGFQAGKWYQPNDPDGEKNYRFIFDGDSVPGDYSEVTRRNKRGHLVGDGVGVAEGYEIRFNPLGPAPFTGGLGLEWMVLSDFQYSGYQIQRDDENNEWYMSTGAVETAITPLDIALIATPLKGGISGKAAMESGVGLTDDAIVIRNGIPTADRFINGSGVVSDANGVLSGVSVKSANGKSVTELATGPLVTKNRQIGVTTAGEIRNAGGRIIPDSPTNPNNPFHCTICNLTGRDMEMLFKAQKNPLKGN